MAQVVHKVKDYEIYNKIIDASQIGKTYKAKNLVTNMPALIIVLDSTAALKESEKNSKDFMAEFLSFQKIKGENLINIIEILRTENHFYVIYEFPDDLNLQTIIDSKGPIPEDLLPSLITDILLAYVPFYRAKKLHKNILSKNVYKSGKTYKMLNFPYTESLKSKAVSLYFYYKNAVPPSEMLENYLNLTLTHKVDIWGIGILFYEIIFGVVPFSGNDRESLLDLLENTIKNEKKILSRLPNPKGRAIGAELADLLEKMLQFEPENRISFEGVLSHAYIQKIKKDQVKYIYEYIKQIMYDLEKNLNVFKNMDSDLKNSINSCLKLCYVDHLKLSEFDILETLKKIPTKFGDCCELLFKIIKLESRLQEESVILEKKPNLGDFPYQTRVQGNNAIPMKILSEDSDSLVVENTESKENFSDDDRLKAPPKLINSRHEQLLNDNLEKIDENIEEFKLRFKEKMNHETEIFVYIENLISSVNQTFEEKTLSSSLIGFILSKYLFIKLEFMKKCLLNKENLFLMDNWKAHVLYLNFENWADNLKKISTRISQTMKSQFNDIKISEIKDKKLLTFINFDTEITSSEEKNYLKLFMKQILDCKDVLEKNNQQKLSKFGYGLILKLLNFLLIYEKFGFFKFDIYGEIDIEKMSQNINKMDKEKMKKEIVYFLKTFLEKV